MKSKSSASKEAPLSSKETIAQPPCFCPTPFVRVNFGFLDQIYYNPPGDVLSNFNEVPGWPNQWVTNNQSIYSLDSSTGKMIIKSPGFYMANLYIGLGGVDGSPVESFFESRLVLESVDGVQFPSWQEIYMMYQPISQEILTLRQVKFHASVLFNLGNSDIGFPDPAAMLSVRLLFGGAYQFGYESSLVISKIA